MAYVYGAYTFIKQYKFVELIEIVTVTSGASPRGGNAI